MELILTQPGFRSSNEPLNLRKDVVQQRLDIREWPDLHRRESIGKLSAYFAGLCSDSIRDPRFSYRTPFTRFYRPITRRIVFKINNGGEEHINWLANQFNGKVMLLIRHPMPVSLSRQYFPELDSILETEFAEFFSESQIRFAKQVIQSDNKLARGLVDWCLRNSVALRSRNSDWVVVSYEQLVVNPGPAIDQIAMKLGLRKPERIHKRLLVPSKSTVLSRLDTREVLRGDRDPNNQRWLVEKWRQDVTDNSLSMGDDIMNAFGLADVYRMTNPFPADPYWIS